MNKAQVVGFGGGVVLPWLRKVTNLDFRTAICCKCLHQRCYTVISSRIKTVLAFFFYIMHMHYGRYALVCDMFLLRVGCFEEKQKENSICCICIRCFFLLNCSYQFMNWQRLFVISYVWLSFCPSTICIWNFEFWTTVTPVLRSQSRDRVKRGPLKAVCSLIQVNLL